MANHEMLLSLYQKRRGLRLLTFFDVEELVVAPEDGICVFDLASKREPEVTINLKCLSLFSTSNVADYYYVIHALSDILPFFE